MKAEFNLTVNSSGEPIIQFKHHDRSTDLEQKLLAVFIEKAKKKGIKLVHKSGYLAMGTNDSWEQFEITTE